MSFLRPAKASLRTATNSIIPVRHSSTSSTSSSTSNSNSNSNQLPWTTYLSHRRTQRRYNLLFSIPTTAAGFVLGAGYFANIEAEPTDLIMGIEPVYAYAAATFACVGLGWLSGPVVGNQVWRLTHRNLISRMERRDHEFYQHIVKNRVDPSRQSVSNPVPDYYCEKVGSLKQYRQWLRDQSAYKRKAQFGEGSEKAL